MIQLVSGGQVLENRDIPGVDINFHIFSYLSSKVEVAPIRNSEDHPMLRLKLM